MSDLEDLDKVDNIKGVKVESEFAIPLVNAKLTLDDVFGKSNFAYLEIDDNNLIHLVYRDELLSLKAKDFARIPKQHFEGVISLKSDQINTLKTNGSVTLNYKTIFNFGINDMEIDSAFMSICALLTSLRSDLKHDISVKISIPGIEKDGNPLEITIDLPYVGTKSSVDKSINLSNYFFDLTKSGEKEFSQLAVDFEIIVNEIAGNDITTTDEIRYSSDFIYNEYSYMFGYVGSINVAPNIVDTIDFDVVKQAGLNSGITGTFTVEDPQIKVIISNSFGVPMLATLEEFSTFSKKYGKIEATGYPNPLKIPVVSKSQIGQTIKDSFTMNKSNSNLPALMSNIPDGFIYQSGAIINPPGNKERNFLSYNSQVGFAINIDIPLNGTAKGFVIEKDQPFEMPEDTLVEVENLLIRLYTENDFPVDVGLQVYFIDSLNKAIDSLFNGQQLILASSGIDGNGRTVQPFVNTVDITMSKERLDKIRRCKTTKIIGTLNTFTSSGTQPAVKIFSDYGLRVKVGISSSFK